MYNIINIDIPKYLTDRGYNIEIGYNIGNRNTPILNVELKALKIHFSYILLRLGLV